jgi:membrane fusion protein (multidrug efflux system)
MNKSILLAALFAPMAFASCHSKKEEKKEISKVLVTNPLLIDTTFTKDYVAEIESLQNIEVRAKVKGFIERINVDEGQQVSAGQTLFTIRSREFEADLAKAKAGVRTMELEVQNVKTLAAKDIVSKTELALAEAKLNEAKAEEGIAATNLSFTRITAPFSGVVNRLKFKVGSLIDEGTLLTSLSNNKEVYAYFNVSEQEYLGYKSLAKNDKENTVTLLLANGEPHKYKGKIETIEGEFDKETGSIPFRAKFPNPDLLLKHGETGKVQLTVNLRNALLIPQKATYELQDKSYVYVVDKNNIVKAKEITIKQKLPNLFAIDAGLSPDDKIILEGLQSLKEDDKVEIDFKPTRQVFDNLQLIKQ